MLGAASISCVGVKLGGIWIDAAHACNGQPGQPRFEEETRLRQQWLVTMMIQVLTQK